MPTQQLAPPPYPSQQLKQCLCLNDALPPSAEKQELEHPKIGDLVYHTVKENACSSFYITAGWLQG